MGKEDLMYMKTYATYSELFGNKFDKGELINLIKEMPLGGLFSILSQLSYFNQTEDKEIRAFFLDHVVEIEPRYGREVVEQLKERVLYHQQGLLSVWKWLLAYGDKNNLDKSIDIEKGIAIIIYLCTIVSDYLYEENGLVDLEYEILRNAAFNSTEELPSLIARAGYIYTDLARNRPLYNDKEYLDFYSDFSCYYGYSLDEYLAVIFGLFALFFKKNRRFDVNWARKPEEAFKNTALLDRAQGVIDSLLLTFEEGQKWALDNINQPWNFLVFQQRPFIKLPDGTFYPFMPRLLSEQIFNGSFFRIRNCYSEQDMRFLNFFGRPFEKYVSRLAEEATKLSPIPYEMIEEFRYGKEKEKRSPDTIIKLGNKLLVIEAKSLRMKITSLITNDPKAVDKDIGRLVINPIRQAHDCIYELIQMDEIPNLSDNTEIYLMVVSLGDFPMLRPFEERINATLESYFRLPIKSVYHLGIDEFEFLCELISRKNGSPIFKVLDNKSKLYPDSSFKNYLFASSLRCRQFSFTKDIAKRYLKQIHMILFPSE